MDEPIPELRISEFRPSSRSKSLVSDIKVMEFNEGTTYWCVANVSPELPAASMNKLVAEVRAKTIAANLQTELSDFAATLFPSRSSSEQRER